MPLPADINFRHGDNADADRFNRATTNIDARLKALESRNPDWEAALAELRQVGLTRLTEGLAPLILAAQDDRARLAALLAGFEDDINPLALLALEAARDGVAAGGDTLAKLYALYQDLTQSEIGGVLQALDAKAPLASPALTGAPTAPTPAGADNSARVATTAYVMGAVAALTAGAPGALNTLAKLAAAINNDANFATSIAASLAAATAALALRLRIDAAQGLSAEQRAQALANLGLTVGAAPNAIVALDGAARLPAVDGSLLVNGAFKAYALFRWTAGAVVVERAFNVAGIVRNGTGDYTVSFAAALPSALYAVGGAAPRAVSVGAHAAVAGGAPTLMSAAQCRVVVGSDYWGSFYGVDPAGPALVWFM